MSPPKGLTTAGKRTIELREAHPDWRMIRIADEVGLSRERVRQLLKRAGLITTQPHVIRCCKRCGKALPRVDGAHSYPKYCSDACRVPKVTLPCNYCGKPVTRRLALYQAQTLGGSPSAKERYRGNVYCSRRCVGHVAGRTWGWAKQPSWKERLAQTLTEMREEKLAEIRKHNVHIDERSEGYLAAIKGIEEYLGVDQKQA